MANDRVLLQNVRSHLRQNNINMAVKNFLALQNVEMDHYALLEVVLHAWYIAGLLETQDLLAFFNELPHAHWTLNGLEILYKSMEMLSEADDFQAMLLIQRRCPMLPIARFLESFKLKLTGSERSRADKYWDEWVSDTVRHVINGTQFRLRSVRNDELMYAPMDGNVFDDQRRRVLTWVSKPFVIHEGRKQESGQLSH